VRRGPAGDFVLSPGARKIVDSVEHHILAHCRIIASAAGIQLPDRRAGVLDNPHSFPHELPRTATAGCSARLIYHILNIALSFDRS
jgi:hypothetical protein